MLWQQYAQTKPANIALITTVKQNKSGEETRFSIEEKCWSWQQINQIIQQQAISWQQQGVKRGDGVALIGRYQPLLVIAYLVALQLGCRVLVLNPMFPEEKKREICEQNEMNYLLDCQQTQIDLEQPLNMQRLTVVEAFAEQSWIKHCPLTLTLTSGSTGLPKAVVHTIEQHLASAKGISPLLEVEASSEWLLSLPLFHVSGQGIVWRWLLSGSALRCVGESIYQDLLQVTHASLVPTQLQQFLALLAEQPEAKCRLTHILLGGAHIPTELPLIAMQQGIKCYSGYGMTEMASTVFAKQSDHTDGVGYLLAEREFKLEHDEVWVKGTTLALGYWQKPHSIRSLLNAQGWFATRDKAFQDLSTGELFIVGRLDNMFISGGENIQPEEIEAVILTSSKVRQAFVLPIDDSKFGQRPVAVIEFIEDFSHEQVQQIEQKIQQSLEKFKWPIAYYPLAALQPVESGIKLSRHQLKEQLATFLQNEA
ncbi:o-succinylbenzoate--CoA ligase [Gallibacterium trehalosifermentans]|uniref:O-succinylbenzoate--CoA ligase n=1 Tax=Gallibacterium trehalosifermentans TaxID=516935 RepID=A0ABV6H0Q3_9PAST